MVKIDPWHSRPFDVHVWSDHKEVMDLTEKVFKAFTPKEQAMIKGRSNNRGKTDLYKHLRHVLVDQYVSYKLDPRLCTGIARGAKHWDVGSRYNALNLSRRIVDVIDLLIKHKLLDSVNHSYHRNTNGRNRTGRIRPSGNLISLFRDLTIELEDIEFHKDEEVIILNDKDDPTDAKSKPQPYEDTPVIIKMRKEVQAYNEMMAEHFVDVASLDYPYLVRQIRNKRGLVDTQRIWTTQDKKFTRRTFSRGSFKLNGRWNGGFWQQLSKELRKNIFIDGSPTIEADYSGLHPNLLALEFDGSFDGDPYTIDKQLMDNQRQVMKGLLLKVINAKSIDSGIRAFQTDEHGYKKQDLVELLDAYVEQYPFMRQAIGSDKGISLMYTDSQIVAEVIKSFVAEDIAILPIHDSFIVREEDDEFLRQEMYNACTKVVGTTLNFDMEYDQNFLNDGTIIQSPIKPNSPYDLRWKSWSDRHPRSYYPDLVDAYEEELNDQEIQRLVDNDMN